MIEFLNKIFIFFSFLLLFFGVNAISNYYIILNTNPKVKASSVLIIGDSHSKTSLNPFLFKNAESISQDAEPYILTFWKLIKVVNIVKPDTILVGFAPHNISAFNDLKYESKKWSTTIFKRSYAVQNFASLSSINIDYMELFKILWKKVCVFPNINHYDEYGGYANANSSDLDKLEKVIERHYFHKNEVLGVSETAISFLDSILETCKNHDIVPILISNPVHESYFNLIPDHIKKRYYFEKKKYESQGIIVLDMMTSQYPDSLYLNPDHLNENGAIRFTNEIRKEIKNL